MASSPFEKIGSSRSSDPCWRCPISTQRSARRSPRTPAIATRPRWSPPAAEGDATPARDAGRSSTTPGGLTAEAPTTNQTPPTTTKTTNSSCTARRFDAPNTACGCVWWGFATTCSYGTAIFARRPIRSIAGTSPCSPTRKSPRDWRAPRVRCRASPPPSAPSVSPRASGGSPNDSIPSSRGPPRDTSRAWSCTSPWRRFADPSRTSPDSPSCPTRASVAAAPPTARGVSNPAKAHPPTVLGIRRARIRKRRRRRRRNATPPRRRLVRSRRLSCFAIRRWCRCTAWRVTGVGGVARSSSRRRRRGVSRTSIRTATRRSRTPPSDTFSAPRV